MRLPFSYNKKALRFFLAEHAPWVLRITTGQPFPVRTLPSPQPKNIDRSSNYLSPVIPRILSSNAIARNRGEFEQALSLEVFAKIKAIENDLLSAQAEYFVSDGFCVPCHERVLLIVDMLAGGRRSDNLWIPNWRERLACPHCHMNNRQRLMATLIKQRLDKQCSDVAKIYFMEQVTPIFNWAEKEFSQHQIYGSEYLGPEYSGGTVIDGVRHEDVMNLSLDDNSIDLVVSNDVFEHVPSPRKTFSECARILKPGGVMLATFPFYSDMDTSIIRAELNANGIKHLMTPVYHDNPISDKGSLVFTDFSWDVLNCIRQAGFADVRIEIYASAEYGHLGGAQLVFIAGKL